MLSRLLQNCLDQRVKSDCRIWRIPPARKVRKKYCLIFNYEFTAQVEKHLALGTVWEVQFTDEDFHIDLNEELYEECLDRTRGAGGGGGEERDMTDVDEVELEEKQDPRVRTTSFGRILRLPNRFY